MWRIMHNFLPHDTNLQRKGISLASKSMCCGHVETYHHLFFGCHKAKFVWNFYGRKFGIRCENINGVHHIHQIWKGQDKKHISNIFPGLILWALWQTRNEAKHKNSKFEVRGVIKRVNNSIMRMNHAKRFYKDQWKGVIWEDTALSFVQKHIPKPIRIFNWSLPKGNWIKINTDASFVKEHKMGGYGGIVWNAKGDILFSFYDGWEVNSVLEVELQAIKQGLKICRRFNLNNIWLEADSLTAIQLINSNTQTNWKLFPFIKHIKQQLQGINWQATHIFREANILADKLANIAIQTRAASIQVNGHLPREQKAFYRCRNLPFVRGLT